MNTDDKLLTSSHDQDRSNDIRNEVFKRTGLKVPIDDPIIELLKMQEQHHQININAMTSSFLKLSEDIDNKLSLTLPIYNKYAIFFSGMVGIVLGIIIGVLLIKII